MEEGFNEVYTNCNDGVKPDVTESGGKIDIPKLYVNVSHCYSLKFGLIEADGSVNKTIGRSLTTKSKFMDEATRNTVMDLWDTCDTWDDCLSKRCTSVTQ